MGEIWEPTDICFWPAVVLFKGVLCFRPVQHMFSCLPVYLPVYLSGLSLSNRILAYVAVRPDSCPYRVSLVIVGIHPCVLFEGQQNYNKL